VILVRNTLLGLIINVYCNVCPSDEGTSSITDTKAFGDTLGIVYDMLSVSVME